MKEFIANAPENQILNILIEKVSINMERHTEVSMGLLYGIITQEASLSASVNKSFFFPSSIINLKIKIQVFSISSFCS